MKKIGLFVLTALLSINIAFSQPPQRTGDRRMTVEERAKRDTEWMKKELNLTQEQIVAVDSINLLFTRVRQSYMQSVEDQSKRIEAMNTLNKEKESALAKVLTPSQLETFKIKLQEQRNNRGNRSGNRDRGGNR